MVTVQTGRCVGSGVSPTGLAVRRRYVRNARREVPFPSFESSPAVRAKKSRYVISCFRTRQAVRGSTVEFAGPAPAAQLGRGQRTGRPAPKVPDPRDDRLTRPAPAITARGRAQRQRPLSPASATSLRRLRTSSLAAVGTPGHQREAFSVKGLGRVPVSRRRSLHSGNRARARQRVIGLCRRRDGAACDDRRDTAMVLNAAEGSPRPSSLGGQHLMLVFN